MTYSSCSSVTAENARKEMVMLWNTTPSFVVNLLRVLHEGKLGFVLGFLGYLQLFFRFGVGIQSQNASMDLTPLKKRKEKTCECLMEERCMKEDNSIFGCKKRKFSWKNLC